MAIINRCGCLGLGLVALAAMLAAGGCATRATYSFYTLRAVESDSRSVPEAGNVAILLEPVSLPGYLQRPQIVSRNGVALHVSEFHRWGEELGGNVTRVMKADISNALAASSAMVVIEPGVKTPYKLSVYIDRMDFEDGKVVLKASWLLRSVSGPAASKMAIARGRSEYSLPCIDGDYSAIAQAISELLNKLGVDIAARIEIELGDQASAA